MDRSGHPIDEAIRECKVPGAEGWRKLTPADPKARKADFGSLALTQSYWTIFLPERRRHTPSKKLSAISETDYTLSKGNVHLVWKLSRVGEKPEVNVSSRAGAAIAHGFNSPFEEFSIALDLARQGVPTIYPRAIYMSGLESRRSALYAPDKRRFKSHRALVTENGAPLFRADHNYLTIWGYWNGSAEMAEDRDEAHVQPMDLGEAVARGLITKELFDQLLERARQRLDVVGYRDLQLRAGHVLLSIRHDKSIVLDPDDAPSIRLCNFELMQKVAP